MTNSEGGWCLNSNILCVLRGEPIGGAANSNFERGDLEQAGFLRLGAGGFLSSYEKGSFFDYRALDRHSLGERFRSRAVAGWICRDTARKPRAGVIPNAPQHRLLYSGRRHLRRGEAKTATNESEMRGASTRAQCRS